MTTSSTDKPNFLYYLHSFRGFAIINIVAIHAIGFSAYMGKSDFNTTVSIGNEILFHNSTIYFALISGLLYTAILKKKGYPQFFMSKFKYVVLPYVFFTLLYTVFDNKVYDFFVYQTSFINYLKDLPRNFIYGKAIFVLWYIPVLLFLYLVTPLLDYILQIKKWGHWLIAIIIAIPLLVRREEVMELYDGDFLSFHNMIYFTGAYAAGMYFADNLERRIMWIRKNKIILLFLAIVSTALLVYVTLQKIDRIGVFSIQSSLYYVQKIIISLLVLLFFNSLGEKQPKWLHPIAKDAFSIYFLHILFIGVFLGWVGHVTLFLPIIQYNAVIGGVFILVASIALSMLVTGLFRKLFGKYSRMIIGA
ncbi:acyltransferase [Flavobacterium luteum]|uniref:Acyltransferase n=1 Tax=Flavobacterium luteum TaxID=2026654 RepID=A0A7J5AGP1_9FLAO|nr:acyltransferase [Flavobacterium luteum]KAB1156776.1 acyltransferase [Flavobacterium luteum]